MPKYCDLAKGLGPWAYFPSGDLLGWGVASGIYKPPCSVGDLQDPNMEVLYHIRPYILKWPLTCRSIWLVISVYGDLSNGSGDSGEVAASRWRCQKMVKNTPFWKGEESGTRDFLNHDWLVVWNMENHRKTIGNRRIWLVVWNTYFSILYGNVIIPTDFHMFQTGWNHQPDEMLACPNIFCQKYTIRYNQTWQWQQRNPQFQL